MKAELQPDDVSEGTIDFQGIYHVIREKAWLISLCTVVAGLLGAAYIAKAHNIYAARTTVQVDQAQRKVVNIQDVNSEDLGSLELLKTIELNLTNGALFENLISTLKLDANSLGLRPRPSRPYSQNELIQAIDKSISVKLLRGTRLISVTAENENPEIAQKISLGLVKEYIRRNIEQRLGVSQEANTFLTGESARLKEKLQKSEQALQDYKEQTQAVSLQETQNITVEKLKELNAKVTGAKSERLKLEADYSQVQKLEHAKPEELLGLQTVSESKAVLEQKKVVGEQEGIVASLSKRYGPLHPKLIQAQSQLKEQKAGLERVIVRSAEAIGAAYEAAKETEAKFELALREQEQKALELNKLAIPYNVLQREVESDRALYESVLNRMKETDVTKSLQQDNILIKEPARVPDKPVRPRRILVLGGSIIAGLFLGLALTLALRALDTSLRTVDEAERELGIAAIGAVPKAMNPISIENGLLILKEPNGLVAEAFRTLRTSLSLLGKESGRRSFLFTSAVPGEGKSFCSINYAVSLAQQDLRTLLIDADLRLPTVGKLFFGPKPCNGLTDILAGQTTLSDAIRSTDVANFSILTAGNRAPNPLELLAGDAFAEVLREAMGKFDRVVLDTAPVNAVSDALLLVKYVDSVCLVVHSGKTPKKIVIRAAQKLSEAGRRPAGFVLNRLPQHRGVGYYYHYSAGSYGDGVYGSTEPA